jgi:hypothetical protein
MLTFQFHSWNSSIEDEKMQVVIHTNQAHLSTYTRYHTRQKYTNEELMGAFKRSVLDFIEDVWLRYRSLSLSLKGNEW